MIEYVAAMLVLVFIASCCQVALKYAAMRHYHSKLAYFLNTTTASTYFVFFLTTIGSVWCLKALPLGIAGCLEASAYLYIMLLDRIFFHRAITFKKLAGNTLIISGIIICLLP